MEWLFLLAAISVAFATHQVIDVASDAEVDEVPWRNGRMNWFDYVIIFIFSLAIWPWLYWDSITHPLGIAEKRRERKAELAGKRKIAKAKAALELAQEGWKLSAENLEQVQATNRSERQSWQAEFDAADAPGRAERERRATAERWEREQEQRRKERLAHQLERDQARQKLADMRMLLLTEEQLQTMAFGYALFRIGAKLIQDELYEDENFALTCYLNYTRRNGHPFREDVSVRAWDGTELWQH